MLAMADGAQCASAPLGGKLFLNGLRKRTGRTCVSPFKNN